MNEVYISDFPVLVRLLETHGFKEKPFNSNGSEWYANVYFDSTGETQEYKAILIDEYELGSYRLVVTEVYGDGNENGECIDFSTFLIMTNGGDAHVVQ